MFDTPANRIQCTVASAPGVAGNFVLAAAVPGWKLFGATDDAPGKTFSVRALTAAGSWEVRTGCRYTHATTTLSRGVLEQSSGPSGGPIALDATTTVGVVLSAGQTAALIAGVGVQGPYTSRLVSALDTGFGAITYTRSSANASVIDHLGLMQFALSGEARFTGARRVCNLVRDTEDLVTGWTKCAGYTKTAAGIKSPNHSRVSAYVITRPSGSDIILTLDALSYRPGTHTFSVWIRGDGVQTYTLAIGATTQSVTPPAGVWTRCAVSATIPDTAAYACYVTIPSAGAVALTVCDPQMEHTHGQVSPAPGEYVPRGVAGFPASLLTAGADGVRYFETANPWSVTAGVATKVTNPAPIDPDVLKGLLLEPAAVNLLWDSGSLATARWAGTGSTTVNATPAASAVLGANSLWKIEEAAVDEGHRISQSSHGALPAAHRVMSGSVFAKAAERSIAYIGLRGLDGAFIPYAYFDLSAGVVRNVPAGVEASMFKVGDLWLLTASTTVGASGSTLPLMNFGCCVTAGTLNYLGTAGAGMWFGAAQLEIGDVSSSYVGDTAAAATLTRADDVCSFAPQPALFPAIGLTVSVDYTPFFKTGTILKDNWWYVWYAYATSADRFGLSLRPGLRGGFTDVGADDWAFDLYPGTVTWDGINILTGQSPMVGETVRTQWSLGTAPQTGLSNQAACVGAVAGITPIGANNIGVLSIFSLPVTIYLGRDRLSGGQRGPASFKNLSFVPVALSAAQMLAAAD